MSVVENANKVTCMIALLSRHGHPMNSAMRKLQVLLMVVTMCSTCGLAQKVKVGYDKSADFSRYKSYTLQDPSAPVSRPLLHASVMGSIKHELETKGLAGVQKDGDLTVIPEGGLDYGLSSPVGATADSGNSRIQKPAVDVQLWAGFMPPPGSAGKGLPEGTLQLTIVDRATNKVVWTGIVVQKLNPDKKEQSLEKVGTAINKLLMEYPPKK
jgi:Domain of unknown function (DUF4136)